MAPGSVEGSTSAGPLCFSESFTVGAGAPHRGLASHRVLLAGAIHGSQRSSGCLVIERAAADVIGVAASGVSVYSLDMSDGVFPRATVDHCARQQRDLGDPPAVLFALDLDYERHSTPRVPR